MKLANSLVRNAVTKNAYDEYHTKLENICIRSNVKSWIDFWYKRCFHFVSAFRGFFMIGVNLAEAGQAGMKCQQSRTLLALVMWLTKTFQHKCARMSRTEQLLRIVHLQEVGHVLRSKNKLMNTGHRKAEFPVTLLICKMAILGWRKQLSKI